MQATPQEFRVKWARGLTIYSAVECRLVINSGQVRILAPGGEALQHFDVASIRSLRSITSYGRTTLSIKLRDHRKRYNFALASKAQRRQIQQALATGATPIKLHDLTLLLFTIRLVIIGALIVSLFINSGKH